MRDRVVAAARRRPVPLAGASTALAVFGAGVLLQQFAVLPLSVWTGAVAPLAGGALGAALVVLVRRRAVARR